MKKWFTIFEMLLVVVIMWILMAAFKDFFLNKDKNKIYFDTCVSRTYGQINTFLWDAMTQKMVYSGTNYLSPEMYKISFDENGQRLILSYDFSWSISMVSKIMLFSGSKNRDNLNKCWEWGYFTKIKNTLEVKIRPGLQQGLIAWKDAGAFSIEKSGNAVITGDVIFSLCEGSNNCMEKTKIIFDKRSFNIDKKTCLKNTRTDGNAEDCNKWSK